MKYNIEYAIRKKFIVDYKQTDALNRLNGSINTRVFSFESPKFKAGCRKFIAVNLREFYVNFYRECQLPLHFYEIILENTPCRLYFDLEYYKKYNKNLNDLKVLNDFLDVCIETLNDLFENANLNRSNFLILDSSNEEKFSAHVIIHFSNNKLFPSNVALKPVVKLICQNMLERNVGIVKNEKSDDLKFICDLSVYTKNRNFRLFLSSKCGKNSILQLADYCAFYDVNPPTKAQIFLDSLIIPKDYNIYSVLNVPNIELKAPKINIQKTSINSTELLNIECLTKPITYTNENSDVTELKSGRIPSPFPELDDHMLQVFQALNSKAKIRIWRLLILKSNNARIMQYQLENCRFCYNKKREHKSQNVYWSVNLNEYYYVQRCFDVIDCCKFVSQKFPIPESIIDSISCRIDKIFERLCHDAAYTESFYSSYYDRLFQELLLDSNTQQTQINDDKNDVIVLS